MWLPWQRLQLLFLICVQYPSLQNGVGHGYLLALWQLCTTCTWQLPSSKFWSMNSDIFTPPSKRPCSYPVIVFSQPHNLPWDSAYPSLHSSKLFYAVITEWLYVKMVWPRQRLIKSHMTIYTWQFDHGWCPWLNVTCKKFSMFLVKCGYHGNALAYPSYITFGGTSTHQSSQTHSRLNVSSIGWWVIVQCPRAIFHLFIY